jgi:hypothetical protein
MPGCILFRWARTLSIWIMAMVVVSAAILPCEASGLFSLGAGHARYKESSALVWDPSWNLTGTCFFDVMPWMQLGLSANYYFIEARPGSELFGVGVGWEEPQGDSWMYSLIPAVRIPFPIGDDGSTQVYLQGGIGWYHLDMDVVYSGEVLGPGEYPVEKRVTEKWDKPGIDGRLGVITRIDGALFLEISPAISVIFTDVESTWSFSGYIAMGLTF